MIRSAINRLSRKVGLISETLFWRRWIRSKGWLKTDGYKDALNPNQPLGDFHRQFVDAIPDSNVKILEVGAGPISFMGKVHPEKRLEIVATDVLADRYEKILNANGINPPVKTIYADAEKLTELFAQNSFDYATANNCLDHCENPAEAILQMLKVLKPGRVVSIRHRKNEATRQNYSGLHKWNFDIEDGEPVLSNKQTKIAIRTLVGETGEVSILPEDDHVILAIKKNC